MKTMKNLITLLLIVFISCQLSRAQHYYTDSFTAQKTNSFTIDGVGDEAFWELCDWYDIQYIWLPFGTTMSEGDFTGRVKFGWTQEKLLVLAEIEDNVLSDVHVAPFDNYYNDDCFEVFLDEDYSGGWHQNDYNAFAYHCAINESDVVDIGTGTNVLLNDHIEIDLDTIDDTHYVWELAISVYDDTYNQNSSDNTPLTLSATDMGIAIAYCDNDGGNERENFIGLIDVESEHQNSAWQDASVFGKLTLFDPDGGDAVVNTSASGAVNIHVFRDDLVIENNENNAENVLVAIFDLNGRLIKESHVYLWEKITLNINDIEEGLYAVSIIGEKINVAKMISIY